MAQRIEVSEQGKRDKVLGSLGYETVVKRVEGVRSEYGPAGFGIGVIPSGAAGRQEHGGPMVAGPWGYLYGRASIIDTCGGSGAEAAKLEARGLLIESVADGDVLVLDGVSLVVKVENGKGIRLLPDDTMRITPEQLANYNASDASRCLYCGSESIDADRIDVQGTSAYQTVKCDACKRTWTDGFELNRILSDDDESRVYYFTGEVES